MVYNNCALYMLLYKQCRGFYCCSKRVINARSVFQEHHLVLFWGVFSHNYACSEKSSTVTPRHYAHHFYTPVRSGLAHKCPTYIYSGTPLIRTPMGPIAIVLISGVSAFQGVKIYSSNGDTFRSFRAKCPLNRGVRISEVRISGVPLYTHPMLLYKQHTVTVYYSLYCYVN